VVGWEATGGVGDFYLSCLCQKSLCDGRRGGYVSSAAGLSGRGGQRAERYKKMAGAQPDCRIGSVSCGRGVCGSAIRRGGGCGGLSSRE